MKRKANRTINRSINYWLLACFLAIAIPCRAQVSLRKILDQYNFSAITINDGLPHNFIDDIYKDSQGFLWLSTHNGLARYDGYSFVNYNITSTTVRLRSNFVNQVCEDGFNRLWVASEAGLDLLNLKTNKLEPIDFSFFKSEDLSKEPVYFIVCDRDKSMWLATQTNLYHLFFTPEGKIERCVALTSKYERHSASTTALSLVNGEIWIGYGPNVFKVTSSKDGPMKLVKLMPSFSFDQQTMIHCFCLYKGAIWVGTDRGLFRYDIRSKKCKLYSSQDGNINSLTQNYITDLAITQNQELVVATLKGLNFYNPATDDFVRLEKSVYTSEYLRSSFINCLLVDGPILWIGTEISGMDKMESRNLKLRLYTNNRYDPNSLAENPVNSIFEDSYGNLWVGNVEQGLGLRKKDTDEFIHYRHQSGNANSLSHNSVCDIAEDNRNQLWIATSGGGVNRTGLNNLPNLSFTNFNTNNTPLRSNFVGSLCFDKLNNGMWIGTAEGLSFYDQDKNKFTNVVLPTDRLPKNSLVTMLIDRKQRLWVGTHHGLIIIDLYSFAKNRKNVHFYYMEYKLDNPQSKLIEKICCIFEASDGTIWLGSNGYGVYRLEDSKEYPYKFSNYTTKNGLCDNTIFGILEDDQHRLWFSTNDGLSCYTPQTGNFANYYQKDGLLSGQFYWNAYCRASDGTLYFGGIDGMIGLNGVGVNHSKKHVQKVIFTRLTVLDNDITQGGNNYLEKSISWANEVHLHERDKSFSLEFSALDYENAGKLKYYYRLKGFDNKWIECDPKRHYASYTNLKSGDYVFQVKVQNPLNMSDSQITELAITVSPFFYKTWWFFILIIFITAIIVFYWYQWRISAYKEQKKILTEKVKERTLELEEKMNVLSNQNDLLIQQKKQLIELSKRIQEITADKISFFTNITHEFRTPISLILGPIDRALKISSSPEVREQLNLAQRNSKSLLSLVNQLLDFRKVESGRIMITKKQNNLPAFIFNTIIPFEAFAKDRQIEVRCMVRTKDTFYLYDEEWMRKVLVNLLSNAIKFTPNGGKVNLYVYSYLNEKGQSRMYISIIDSGVGVLQEDMDKIFDRFYQSRKNVKFQMYGQSGTGIGLYLCKRIINEHGGRIYARNNKKAGLGIRILMPMDVSADQTELQKVPENINEEQDEMENEYPVGESVATIKEKTILIVDDNLDMRVYVRSILQSQYKVLEAEDGEHALEVLHKENIDFIVSDLMMPVMDGLELSRRVKEDLSISHIPILILTAKVSDEARLDSFRIGVDEYLQKPFSEELLLVRIQNIFNVRRHSQQQFDQQMTPSSLNIDKDSRDSKFLNSVMEVIECNYGNPDFDVESFATAMNMSKTLLNQKLQSLVGQSIAKFVSNYRLKKAQALIQVNKNSKNMNVSEIAYEVGFNDPKYFSRCYLKKYGVLPSTSLE